MYSSLPLSLSFLSAILGSASIAIAQLSGGGGDAIPSWVGVALTPTAAALLLVSGVLMRTKVHETDMESMWKLYDKAIARAEASEEREREYARTMLPALSAATAATDRALAAAMKGSGNV